MNQTSRRDFLHVVGAGILAAPFLAPWIVPAGTLDLSGKPFKGSLLGTKYEGMETTAAEVQHAYFADEKWEKKAPAFMEYNAAREDNNAKRSEMNLKKHDPQIQIGGNRAELTVDFKNKALDPKDLHPHAAGHWWSWFEIWDNASDPAWIFVHEPAEGETRWGKAGVDFGAQLFLKNPLKGNLIRVRAYCVTHGLYTKYFPL
ncbi:MAG: hypothetical protein AB1405_06245 [Bdellovibrionota bacterium]